MHGEIKIIRQASERLAGGTEGKQLGAAASGGTGGGSVGGGLCSGVEAGGFCSGPIATPVAALAARAAITKLAAALPGVAVALATLRQISAAGLRAGLAVHHIQLRHHYHSGRSHKQQHNSCVHIIAGHIGLLIEN
ncbi:hypothetical protein GOP47_0017212 [Adiantum capillus-veneris]|uniref:Uncharacterized protein n=1 Tax=Adiantum capillus-veneris TaxID=13818 RepID=A0A9D4UJH5_ADICA|nr:hypothetical protein GOP47_0017212 [Adiantum capillus-veneris]